MFLLYSCYVYATKQSLLLGPSSQSWDADGGGNLFYHPTFFCIIQPRMPFSLAQCSPLCLVLEDGHPTSSFRFIKLHPGSTRVWFHSVNRRRGRSIWGRKGKQPVIHKTAGRKGPQLQWQSKQKTWNTKNTLVMASWRREGQAWGSSKGLLRMLISVETFILVPPLRCQSFKIHSLKSHIFSKKKGQPERSNKSILDVVLSLQSLPQSIPIHSVTTPAAVSKAPHRVDDLGTPEALQVCCAVR